MNTVIATLLLISLAVLDGKANASAYAPAAAAAIRTTDDQTSDQGRHDGTKTQVAALDPAEPSTKSSAQGEPFSLNATPVTSGELLTKWIAVEADISTESKILA